MHQERRHPHEISSSDIRDSIMSAYVTLPSEHSTGTTYICVYYVEMWRHFLREGGRNNLITVSHRLGGSDSPFEWSQVVRNPPCPSQSLAVSMPCIPNSLSFDSPCLSTSPCMYPVPNPSRFYARKLVDYVKLRCIAGINKRKKSLEALKMQFRRLIY